MPYVWGLGLVKYGACQSLLLVLNCKLTLVKGLAFYLWPFVPGQYFLPSRVLFFSASEFSECLCGMQTSVKFWHALLWFSKGLCLPLQCFLLYRVYCDFDLQLFPTLACFTTGNQLTTQGTTQTIGLLYLEALFCSYKKDLIRV